MATINYTTESDVDAGSIKVEWSGMAPGDDGQPFNCQGLQLASIHYWGDFNSGAGLMSIMASNEISPTLANFGEFAVSHAQRMQLYNDGQLAHLGAVLPLADANMIDGNVCMLFVSRH